MTGQLELVCPVCLSLFTQPHSLKECGHEFCAHCIRRVLQVKRSCPVCRHNLPEHAPLEDLTTPNRHLATNVGKWRAVHGKDKARQVTAVNR